MEEKDFEITSPEEVEEAEVLEETAVETETV